jgi:hypothetical protein
MTEPEEPRVVWTDAQGRVVADRADASGGEVIETLSDGSVKSTIFRLEGREPAAE